MRAAPRVAFILALVMVEWLPLPFQGRCTHAWGDVRTGPADAPPACRRRETMTTTHATSTSTRALAIALVFAW